MNNDLVMKQHEIIEELREQLTKALRALSETHRIAQEQSADIEKLCQINQILMGMMSESDLEIAAQKLNQLEKGSLQ